MTTAAGRDADAVSDLGGGGLDAILAGVMLRSAGLMAGTVAQVARAVAQSPGAAARHSARGLRRQLQVAAGASEELPELDRRFADPAWRDNPFLRRLAQSYRVWPPCYRTRSLLGGRTRFVLATGGHAKVVGAPPGTPRLSYRTGDSTEADPAGRLSASTEQQGSWWEDWCNWLTERAPATKPAPTRLGSAAFPPLADAPGDMVHRRVV